MNDNINNMWQEEIGEFIENGKNNMVELLINNELLDVQSLYFEDNKPILLSIYYEFNISTIVKLLNKGCNINEQNDIGWFPLYIAVDKNNYVYTKFLLDNNADINKQYYNEKDIQDKNNGKSILHILLEKPILNLKLINLILKYKPDVNLLDYQFNTALHYLLKNNNYKYNLIKKIIIKKILERKPKLTLYNIDNKSILDIGNENNINLLKINKEVILKKKKSMLQICKGYNNRLGKKSSIKYLPIDLVEEMFRLSL